MVVSACTQLQQRLRAHAPSLLRVGQQRSLLPALRPRDVASRAKARGDRSKEPVSDTAYLEAAVPRDQRPVNELGQLKDDALYSWVSIDKDLDHVLASPHSPCTHANGARHARH